MGPTDARYELLDAGDGRRLERFADLVLDRPHPGADGPRRDRGAWAAADLRFDRRSGWQPFELAPAAAAVVEIEAPPGSPALRMSVRPTPSGGVGLFPEHAENVPWLQERVRAARAGSDDPPAVLHLFAHTGLLTLAAAAAGAAVVHVDASRPAVAWARENAAASGLETAPIRWIVDDALGFLGREARRGRRYDGVVLDPPSHGHAGRQAWHLEDRLDDLLAAVAAVADPGAFVLLTAHTPGFEAHALADRLAGAMRAPRLTVEGLGLTLRARSGAVLPLGAAARLAPEG